MKDSTKKMVAGLSNKLMKIMKKSIYFAAAALLMLVACNKETVRQNESISLKASVEQHVSGTKTALDGASVVWVATDAIKIYNEDGSANVNLTTSDDGANADFSGPDLSSGAPTVAIYPAGAATGSDGTNITFTLPNTQTYAADSFDPACNVTVGSVSGDHITFKNTCGLLKLQLKGILRVGKIVLTSKNVSDYLYGTFTANATVAEPKATRVSGGGNSITLDCSANAGVQLDRETATNFYFVVPDGCLTSGFTATVYDIYNSYAYSKDIETTKNNEIHRSKVRAMPAVKVSLLPAEYTEAKYLQSSGKWIDTGVADTYTDPLYGVEYVYAIASFLGSGNHWLWGNTPAKPISRISRHLIQASDGAMIWELGSSILPTSSDVKEKNTNFHEVRLGSNYDDRIPGIIGRTFENTDGNNDTKIALFKCCSGTGGTVGDEGSHTDGSDCTHPEKDSKVQFQYFRMLSGSNTLVRYYIPCTNSSSVPGMYDMVSGTFEAGKNDTYPSAGTGVFSVGVWE